MHISGILCSAAPCALQAQKQQAQAQQALQSKCAELQQAANSFDPIVQQLDEVRLAA